MSNRDLPMMPWFPDQFAASTAHFTFAERSAYRALLDVQWAIGTLPVDNFRLADAIRMPGEDFDQIWPVVSKKFTPVEGGLQNFRLEQHRLNAFRKKQGHVQGAEKTNAKRSAQRTPSDTLSERSPSAERNAKRHASDTPLFSQSPSHSEEPPFPPDGGDGADALGEPEGNGRRGRDVRAQSAAAWNSVLNYVRSSAHRKGPHPDPDVQAAVYDIGGYQQIAVADEREAALIKPRFRQAYEERLGKGTEAPAPAVPA